MWFDVIFPRLKRVAGFGLTVLGYLLVLVRIIPLLLNWLSSGERRRRTQR